MLTDLCEAAHNWFDVGRYHGNYKIVSGAIQPLDFLKDGQYFRIVGSVFNDGVYQYPTAGLTDEEFEGEIWAMAVPKKVLDLADKIKSYAESKEAQPSAYTSESFAGYSYSKATGNSGAPLTWQDVFANDIAAIRRPIL